MDAKVKLKQLMSEYGWSEYRLSKESDLAQSTIANLFKRNNAPTLPTLERVCDAFGITLAQFFSDGSEPVLLTEQQLELLKYWNPLTEEQKCQLIELMKTM